MLENPASLLKSTILSFEIEPDIQIVTQINKKIHTLESLRLEKIQNQEAILRSLLTEYEAKLGEIQALENSAERTRVLKEINQLNSLKSKIARDYTELESEINELNLLISKKTQQLEELRNLNVLGSDVKDNPDSTVLKLKVYRNFGVLLDTGSLPDSSFMDLISDLNQSYRVVVTNTRTGVASSIAAGGKLSDHFVANQVWDRL